MIESITNTTINEQAEHTMTGLTAFFLLSTAFLAVLGFGVLAGLAALFVKFTLAIFALLSALSLAFGRPEPREQDVPTPARADQRA